MRDQTTGVADAEGVDEHAAGWCLRLAEATLLPAEQRNFEHWLAEPRHRKAFEEAVNVWQAVDNAADEPELIRLRSRALDSLQRTNRQRWTGRLWLNWPRVAIAGAFFVLVVPALLIALHAFGSQVFETGTAERRIVRLDDGSQLSLDAASRVEVRFARHHRELRLVSGRARFDVAKDPLRPFDVTAGDKVIVAVGTSFSIELVHQQVHVVLYEGKAVVLQAPMADHSAASAERQSAPGRELTPGRELWSPLGREDVSVATADIPRSEAWQEGQLSFVNEPLSLAVERVNRYSQVKLVLADPGASAITINGVFNAGDVAAFLEGVRSLSPVSITEQPGQIVIASEPAAQK